MKDWWEEFNDEIQKGIPFIVFTTWLLTVAMVVQEILRRAK